MAQEAAATGRSDPFLLNFLFAMGELSGQVSSLAKAVERLEKRLEGQDDEIESLKQWRWVATGAAGVIGSILGIVGEYLVQHGWH